MMNDEYGTRNGCRRQPFGTVRPRTNDIHHSSFIIHRWLAPLIIHCSLLIIPIIPAAAQQLESEEVPAPIYQRALNVRFDNLSLEDGLSQSTVFDVLQDDAGYVWMATMDGLNRYDGYDIQAIDHQPFDSTSLPDTWASALSMDRNGDLWVGGQGVISRMNRATGAFTRHYFPVTDSTRYRHAAVTSIVQDSTGALWVGTLGLGLHRLDTASGSLFTKYVSDPDNPESITAGSILGLFIDSRNDLWVNSSGGVCRMRLDEPGKFDRYLEENPTEWGGWGGFVERPEEQAVLWIGRPSGLMRLDIDSGAAEIVSPATADVSTRVGDLVQDPLNPSVLWLGLNEGVARFDIASRSFVRYTHDEENEFSARPGWTLGLTVDRSGTVWAGTWGSGVEFFRPSSIGVELVGSRPQSRGVFEGHDVRPIFLGRDGTLWVGSNFRNEWMLTALNRDTEEIRVYRHRTDDSTSLFEGRIGGILEDRSGTLWVTGPGTLSRLDRRSDSFVHYRHDPTDPSSMTGGIAAFMNQDRNGIMWIGSTEGVLRMDPRRPGVFEHFRHAPEDPQTLSSNLALQVVEDASGYIWTSSLGGVNRLDPTTGKVTHYRHDPNDRSTLASDRVWDVMIPDLEAGVVWVSGFGLSRLDVGTGTFRLYTTADGLPNNAVYGALEDDRGMIWVSTNHGLSRLNPLTETFRNYGLEAGLQSLEFNSESLHKGYTGELFFGGINGLNAFYPNALSESPTEPETRIVDIKVKGQSIRDSDAFVLKEAVPFLDELTLEPEQNEVSFDFNAFHYKYPEKNEYAYKLEGLHTDWVHIGTQRVASFANLDPGEYTLLVKAANSDGLWDEVGASLDIVVLPPWWRTWWAYALYVVCFGLGVFVVDRFQRRRLIEKERERTRERELEQAREIKKAYEELDKSHQHLKNTQEQLIHAEKMASLGQLTAGIAHEIKNPLNFVNNFSDMSRELAIELEGEIEARRETLPEDFVDNVDDILQSLKINAEKIYEHGRRADGIVYSMLQHSRGGEGERLETDVNAFLDEYLNLAYHGMRARNSDFNATLQRDYDPLVGKIEIVPQDMGRVFLNLIGNAFDALEEHGAPNGAPTVSVSTERRDGAVEIRIADNGPGIPEHVRAHIFEPFFTTKPTGKGTGLGLSMSYDIVTKGHGGSLDVVSEEGAGATFIVRLPV